MKFNIVNTVALAMIGVVLLSGAQCSKEDKDVVTTRNMKANIEARQPMPVFAWSQERHLLTELYKIRNKKVSTYSIWRSDMGQVNGLCPSMGFSLPYDTSLTNPKQKVTGTNGNVVIDMMEPNAIYASKNTSATWIMCLNDTGTGIEPIYTEDKVTVYPYAVTVNWETNRVIKAGKSSVVISQGVGE